MGATKNTFMEYRADLIQRDNDADLDYQYHEFLQSQKPIKTNGKHNNQNQEPLPKERMV